MAAISIHRLDSIARSSIPLEQVSLPKLTHATRAIFKEVEAEIIRVYPQYIKEPKYLPDLTSAFYLCRNESIKERSWPSDNLLRFTLLSFIAVGIAFYVHLIAVAIFGIVTTATFLAIALPFAVFLPVTMVIGSDIRRQNHVDEILRREMRAFEEYFSRERVDWMKGQISKRIESLKNDENQQQLYKIVLEQLVSAYAFRC